MIVGLFTDLLPAGGVQRAGRHTAAVLAAYAEQRGEEYRFLSLGDPHGSRRVSVGELSFGFRGFGASKPRFALAAMRLGLLAPRLVLALHPHLAPATSLIKFLAPGAATVVVAHGVEVWTRLPASRRRGLAHATAVFAPSTYTAGALVDVQGVPEEKVRLLPWGLDSEFEIAPGAHARNHLPPGFPRGRVLLTVGRLSVAAREKGFAAVIQALPRLRPAESGVHLVVVGEGDDRARLEQLAADLGVAGQVHFVGELTARELAACYRQCDAFVMPSSVEGFGLVFLEAMACGKPVVGGAHGGTTDIIADGQNGYLVPPDEIGRLAEVLEKLIAHDDLRRELGRRGQERVAQNYLFEHFRSRLLRLMDEICAS